ncbi:MAG: GNAT family N-acetyltransferase [Polyangiales bacterium]
MIGPKDSIPAARWAEKLREPFALREGDGFLYRPPARRGATASLAWIFDRDPDAALRRACDRAEADGAATLYVGGPPGNYLVSGADERDAPWFRARGFAEGSAHVDLVVDARAARPDARVVRPEDVDGALAWVELGFGVHWRAEAARAASRDGLWVTRDDEGVAGFVAIGGNNADAGTFGPVGVAPRARGRGLGEALTGTALHALAAEGFAEVTVPWVEAGTARFYARVATVLREVRRVRLARRFPANERREGGAIA